MCSYDLRPRKDRFAVGSGEAPLGAKREASCSSGDRVTPTGDRVYLERDDPAFSYDKRTDMNVSKMPNSLQRDKFDMALRKDYHKWRKQVKPCTDVSS